MRGTKNEVRPGVWRLRVVTGYDAATGNPRQRSRTMRGTKRQAESALAAFVADAESSAVAMNGTTTVAELLDRWMEYLTPQRSPTTIRGYADKLRRLKATLGRVKVEKLTAQDLDRAYAAWLKEGLSASSVHHHHAVLSAALNQAVRWGTIPDAVTRRASPPPLRVKRAAATDPEVVRCLVRKAEPTNPVLAAAILVGALTGARRSELCGLQWHDFDEATATLHIRRAVKLGLGRGEVVVGDTKSHAERRVSLDPVAAAVLVTHRARVAGRAAERGRPIDPHGFILTPDPTGTNPWDPNRLTQAFVRLCRKAGVVGLPFHGLRHFSASMLIGAGLDPPTVANRLGHADPAITRQIYAGAIEARDRAAAEVLGNLFSHPAQLAAPQ